MNKLSLKPNQTKFKFQKFSTIYYNNKTDVNVLINKVKLKKKNEIKKNFYLSFIAVSIVCLTGSVIF